jgi:arylsulfatase A-like enzyme
MFPRHIRTLARRLLRFAAALSFALPASPAPVCAEAPRLVVVLVIDQLPRSYLDRFAAHFGERGFRRLLESGADYSNAHYDHAVTTTGPGHGTLLTGAHPRSHGVIDNHWYSRGERRVVGCVEDARFPLVGAAEGAAPGPGVSPLGLRSPTLGDVLRAGTGLGAKVVAVSLKDRSAVLMGGARPNGAYWFDESRCAFVSSTYYGNPLPDWVEEFNAAEPCSSLVGTQWEKLDASLDYTSFAAADDRPFESDRYGLGRTFPHPVRELAGADRFAAVVATPLGNDLLASFARAAVRGEKLGADHVPDLLAISFSTNDYVGHLYGPRSQEVADATFRTDLMLAGLLEFIDFEVGMGRWTLVLTSDHGIAPIPESLEEMAILPLREDHHRFDVSRARGAVERALADRFSGAGKPPADFPGFFAAWDARTLPFVYLEAAAADRLGRTPEQLLAAARDEIAALDGVARVYARSERAQLACSGDPLDQAAARSWDDERGGDLMIRLAPHWLPASAGTTHGAPYPYDTHVPLIFYGAGIRPGRHAGRVSLVDLAPTLAHLLGVEAPPQNEGQVLVEALR